MAGVSYINPAVNPETIHRYIVLGIRIDPVEREGVEDPEEPIAHDQPVVARGQPVITAYFPIRRSSYVKNIAVGSLVGAAAGATVGVMIAIPCILLKKGKPATKAVSKMSRLGEKAALKILGKSALIGASCGGAVGGITAAIITHRYNSAVANLRENSIGDLQPAPVDVAIQNRHEEVVNMCRALFDAMFEDVDVFCAISREVMIMPTNMPQGGRHSKCTGVFEFTNIYQWVFDHGTCPMCRRQVRVEDLRFCDRTFIKINRAVHAVLAQLRQTIDRADPALLNEALNNPEAQINENTAQRIRDGGASPLECAIIARYLRPGIANYNAAIMDIYFRHIRYLETLRDNGTLTPQGFLSESRRIADWCETYQFPAE